MEFQDVAISMDSFYITSEKYGSGCYGFGMLHVLIFFWVSKGIVK